MYKIKIYSYVHTFIECNSNYDIRKKKSRKNSKSFNFLMVKFCFENMYLFKIKHYLVKCERINLFTVNLNQP